MGVVGCPRNCAEATVKDIGLVGQDGSWQVVVGGAAGKSVRKADLLITVETTEQALEACELFFQYYRENANYLERTYDFVERLGIDQVRRETIYAQRGGTARTCSIVSQNPKRFPTTPGWSATIRARQHSLRKFNPWTRWHYEHEPHEYGTPEHATPLDTHHGTGKYPPPRRARQSKSMATRSRSSTSATASWRSKTAARTAAVP